MRLTLFCTAATKDENEPTRMAGCGIVLYAESAFTQRGASRLIETKKRSLSFGLGSSSIELANIQAVKLTLASVARMFRSEQTFLNINSNSLMELLVGSRESEYVEELTEMRKWLGYYLNMNVVLNTTGDWSLVEAGDLAQNALRTQKNTDSGTVNVS